MKITYKKDYFSIGATVIICVLLFLLFRRCGDGGTKHSGQDTIKREIRIDTVRVHDTVKSYAPKPDKTEYPKWESGQFKYDTNLVYMRAESMDSLILSGAIKDGIITSKNDSLSILRQYLATRYYSDKQKVQYGTVTINDTVTRNRIVGRSLIADFNIPVVTKTYTIEAQKRTVLYVGADIYGNLSSPVYGVGAALGLKGKNDKSYEIKALMSKEGTPIYGFGYRIPIRLRKK